MSAILHWHSYHYYLLSLPPLPSLPSPPSTPSPPPPSPPHHHQLETGVFRGQYLQCSSRIEILFGTSTKAEVNLAFTITIIIFSFYPKIFIICFISRRLELNPFCNIFTPSVITIWWCGDRASCKSWIKMTETLLVFPSFQLRLARI